MTSMQKIREPRDSVQELNEIIKIKSEASDHYSGSDHFICMEESSKLNKLAQEATDYCRLESEVNGIKINPSNVHAAMTEKDVSSRKFKAGSMLRCSVSEIVEGTLNVSHEQLNRVFNKASSTAKRVESSCEVQIYINHNGVVSVFGRQSNVDAALNALVKAIGSCCEEFQVSDEAMACLCMNKAASIQDLQGRYNVRIDASRAFGTCKVTGLINDAAAVREYILSIQSIHVEIPLTRASFQCVIGKGANDINAIKDCCPMADIELPRSTKCLSIFISGIKSDVEKAEAMIMDKLDRSSEISTVVESNKYAVLGCFGSKKLCSQLEKDFNVKVQINTGLKNTLMVTGSRSKVTGAVVHLEKMLDAYEQCRTPIEVLDYMVPVILGKNGTRIKALRSNHPQCIFDVEGNTIHIHSTNEVHRTAAVKALEEIINVNYRATVQLDTSFINWMRTHVKGQKFRAKLIDPTEYDLHIDFDRDNNCINLRGRSLKVAAGIDVLQEMMDKRNGYSDETSKYADSVVATSATSPVGVNYLSVATSTDSSDWSNNTVSLSVESPLSGKDDSSLTSLTAPTVSKCSPTAQTLTVKIGALATLIGKNGHSIRQFEIDNKVKVDVLRESSKVCVRGDDRQGVNAACVALVSKMDAIQSSSNVTVPKLVQQQPANELSKVTSPRKLIHFHVYAPKSQQDIVDILSDQFCVSTEISKVKWVLKGNLDQVDEAKKYLKEVTRNDMNKEKGGKDRVQTSNDEYGVAQRTIRLAPFSNTTIETDGLAIAQKLLSTDITKIRSFVAKGVSFEFTSCPSNDNFSSSECTGVDHSILIKGATIPVIEAQQYVFDQLAIKFPGVYKVITIPDSKCFVFLAARGKLMELSIATNVILIAERPLLMIYLCGEAGNVSKAVVLFENIQKQFSSNKSSMPITESLIGPLLGKSLVKLRAIESSTNTTIQFNRGNMTLDIEANDSELVARAVEVLKEKISELEKTVWTLVVQENCVGQLLGKGGVKIKKLRKESGADIEFMLSAQTISVKGTPATVAAAKAAILGVIEFCYSKNYACKYKLPVGAAQIIVGAKGDTIRGIEEKCEVKADLDRKKKTLGLKGMPACCDKALVDVKKLLAESGISFDFEFNVQANISTAGGTVEGGTKPESVSTDSTPDSAGVAAVALDGEAALSKSAIRRKRRKEKEDVDDNGQTSSASFANEDNGTSLVPTTDNDAGMLADTDSIAIVNLETIERSTNNNMSKDLTTGIISNSEEIVVPEVTSVVQQIIHQVSDNILPVSKDANVEVIPQPVGETNVEHCLADTYASVYSTSSLRDASTEDAELNRDYSLHASESNNTRNDPYIRDMNTRYPPDARHDNAKSGDEESSAGEPPSMKNYPFGQRSHVETDPYGYRYPDSNVIQIPTEQFPFFKSPNNANSGAVRQPGSSGSRSKTLPQKNQPRQPYYPHDMQQHYHKSYPQQHPLQQQQRRQMSDYETKRLQREREYFVMEQQDLRMRDMYPPEPPDRQGYHPYSGPSHYQSPHYASQPYQEQLHPLMQIYGPFTDHHQRVPQQGVHHYYRGSRDGGREDLGRGSGPGWPQAMEMEHDGKGGFLGKDMQHHPTVPQDLKFDRQSAMNSRCSLSGPLDYAIRPDSVHPSMAGPDHSRIPTDERTDNWKNRSPPAPFPPGIQDPQQPSSLKSAEFSHSANKELVKCESDPFPMKSSSITEDHAFHSLSKVHSSHSANNVVARESPNVAANGNGSGLSTTNTFSASISSSPPGLSGLDMESVPSATSANISGLFSSSAAVSSSPSMGLDSMAPSNSTRLSGLFSTSLAVTSGSPPRLAPAQPRSPGSGSGLLSAITTTHSPPIHASSSSAMAAAPPGFTAISTSNDLPVHVASDGVTYPAKSAPPGFDTATIESCTDFGSLSSSSLLLFNPK